TSLDLIGKSAIGVGLISIGASLNLKSLFRPSPLLLVSASLKLLVMPLIGAPLIWYFGLEGTSLAVVVISLAVPTATTSYVLAREMGGDYTLMAEILTFQTV